MTTKHTGVTPETASVEAVAGTFTTLGISPKILAILEKGGFITPTPIQAKVIPLGVQGKDIIGIAQTGTGKTLGFGIPMIERLLANPDGRGLVVLPTRELALQVEETLRKIGGPLGVGTTVLIGGDSMYRQVRELRNGPSIVIATPGRLLDHVKQKNISLSRVSIVVLDEADHMFDIGFAPQIREIMKLVPKARQTLLFSATMPNAIATLAMEHMLLPLRIETAAQGTASKNVEQEIIVVNRPHKFNLLVKVIGEQGSGVPIIVFTRTKHGAKDVASGLRNVGITASEIHSNRTLAQRREALDGFKKHTYQVLAATDIAARGIDVKDIGLVVNYDLPEQSEDYVHRIGRTGRAGKSGKAISFATPDQKYDIVAIERLMKKTIPTKSHEGAAMSAVGTPRVYRGRGGFSGGFRGGRNGFTRGAGGRPVASGAFRTHTNQPFKGGAPRSTAGDTASAPRSYSSARPSYSERSSVSRPSYGASRSATGSSRPSYSARPSTGYAGRSSGARSTGGYAARSSFGSARPAFGARPSFGASRGVASASRSGYAPRAYSSRSTGTGSSYSVRPSTGYAGRSSGARSTGSSFRSAGPRTGGASRAPRTPFKGR